MALFKICKGKESNLPSNLVNGYCYFCTDTTNFYIDHEDKNGALTRSKLSSKYADTLRYTEDGNFVEINPTDIVTKNNYETTISVASTDKNGLMSSADKTKLNNIPEDISASLANDFISAKGGAYSLDTTLQLSLNNIPTVISGLYDNPIFRISTDGLKYSESDTQSYDFASFFTPIGLCLNRTYSEGKHPVTSYFSSNIWQMLDDVIDGDHRKFYLRSNSLQWRRYNGGWKNHYISAELDKLKIYNDQKLISFENSKLENIAAPTADNDAATKKYVDDKVPVEATTTNSGLLSAADKIKLDSVESGANKNVQVDWNQNDSTAEDYVKNRICYENNADKVLCDVTLKATDATDSPMASMFNVSYGYPEVSFGSGELGNNRTVTVTLDGVSAEYTMTNSGGISGDTEPFTIGNYEVYFMEGSGSYGPLMAGMYSNADLTGKKLTMTIPNHEIKQIDSKFLPNYPVYATCTSAANSNKVATTDFDFSLSAGRRVAVKFTNANTKSQPSLNINSTGNKTIIWNSQTLPFTQYWKAGSLVEFVYDGSYYQVVGTINDTTYSAATTSSQGLMSAADKIKLNGIAQNANNYILPVATADALGGVKPTVKTDNMTKEVGIDVDGKLYVDDNTMIVNITATINTNGNTTYTADKTSQEIASAVANDKKNVVAILYDTEAYLSFRCVSAKLTATTSESVFMVFSHGSKSRAIMKISNSGAEDTITVNIDKMAMAFVITSSTDDGGTTTYSSTCTCDEILDALASGVLPMCGCGTDYGTIYVYSRANIAGQYLQFTNVDAENTGFKYVNIYFDGTVEVGENIIPESVYLHQGTENAGKTLVVGDDGNVSVSDESAFVVNITNVDIAAKTAQSDKTYAEIKEAYEKGRTVYGVVTGKNNSAMIFPLTQFRTPSGLNVVDLMGEIGSGVEMCFVVADDGKTNVFTYQYVNMRQGTENAGKILGIANNGIVTPIDKPTFTIDTTLTKSGQAADAKTVGDMFTSNSANLMAEINKKANSSDIPDISGKVDKLQGTDNAGKLLSVGNDGNVTTLSADNFLSSSGGEYTTNGVYKFIKASTGNYVNIDSNNSEIGIYVQDTDSALGRSVFMDKDGFYVSSRDSEDGFVQLSKNKLNIFDQGSTGTHEMNIGINDAHNTYISSYTKKLYFEESVLKNIGAPVDSTDAVTKKYVDEKFASATIKTWTAADMT